MFSTQYALKLVTNVDRGGGGGGGESLAHEPTYRIAVRL